MSNINVFGPVRTMFLNICHFFHSLSRKGPQKWPALYLNKEDVFMKKLTDGRTLRHAISSAKNEPLIWNWI